MARKLGPVLALQDSAADIWTVSALVVFEAGDTPPPILWWGDGMSSAQQVAADAVEAFDAPGADARTMARYILELPLGDAEYRVTYGLDGDDARWSFHVPAEDFAKLRLGYASCNGFSQARTERDVRDKYDRWLHFRARHAEQPLHVLLLGGDQVYGDPIWETVPPVRRWAKRDTDAKDSAGKWTTPYGEQIARATRKFYGRLYEDRWNQVPFGDVLAEVPSLMMWDDHDIFDGWGSHPEQQTASPVYQGIFAEARRYFRVLQLQNVGDAPGRQALCPEHNHTYGMRIGPVAVLALDMRTERTPEQVISPAAWERIYGWLDQLGGGEVAHLLVMTSVPVVHLNFGALEQALALMPGRQELEDDFRDHWLSRPHQKERLRLIHRLFRYAQRNDVRVTVLSGDVHVGGMGVLEDHRDPQLSAEASTIMQLISSPVVHPTPPQMVLYTYDALNFFEGEQEVEKDITSRMLKLPASDHRFLGRRNWLELEIEPSDKGRIWANWFVEGDDEPYTAVIHKIGRETT